MTTHRAVVSSLVLVSLWAFVGCGRKPQHLTKGDEPNRHHEAGFSFVPPADWEIREMPGMKYKPALAKPEDGFAPNVNVVDEAFSGSLTAYVVANMASLSQMLPKFDDLGQFDFSTDDGVAAKKVITQSEQSNIPLRQIFYMFPGQGRYFVMTCSDLQKHNTDRDADCDTAAKSFRID